MRHADRGARGAGDRGAILLAVSLPIIAAAYPQERRGGPIAIYGAVMGAGSAAGPLLGGFLVTHFGWQSIFLVNLPVGVIALIIAARHLPETRAEQTRPVDWVGTMLLTCGLLTGVFAVISLHDGESAPVPAWPSRSAPWWPWRCSSGGKGARRLPC